MDLPRGWWMLQAVAAITALTSAVAAAEPAPSFAELLRRAEASAPALAVSEAEVRAAQGRADQAGARPNPTVSLEVEDFAGSGAYGGLSRSQTTLSFSQPLELGGKRGARTATGRAQVNAAEARQRQSHADFAYDLALAYAAAEGAQARAELIDQDLQRAQDDLRAARALVDAGREADVRAVQAQASVSAARADLETTRADVVEALGRLSAMVGAPSPYTAIGPSLLAQAKALPPRPEPTSVTTPAVAAAAAERDAAAKQVRMERTKAVPDLTVSVGARRLAGDDATTVVGGLSAPLPLFDRNRGAVSAAAAELTAAEARLRAAQLDAEADRRSGQFRAAATAVALQAAEEGEASAGEAYRLARVGYDAGRSPLAELLSSRRALTEAQLRTLDAKSQRIRAEAALARLAGASLGE